MDKICRVLVTGAGSGVGQGILKALKISDLNLVVISSDISSMSPGLYRSDEAIILPPVEQDGALVKIIDALKENRIDVVMIGSEFDLSFFSENKKIIEEATGAIIIAANPETIKIADDKWLTAEFLRKEGLPYAEAVLPSSLSDAEKIATQWGYPVVLKSRSGTSSRNVHIVKDAEMLANCFPATPGPMLQRVIDMPNSELRSEYTCSVFKGSDGALLGPFTARRTVKGGTSWQIEVAAFDEINEFLLKLGSKIDFIGSLNVQLMIVDNKPIPFELNSRFSGTTAVRAHFGFNEPDMAIRSYFFQQKISNPIIRKGVAMRYHEEVFIDDVSADELTPSDHRGLVNQWF